MRSLPIVTVTCDGHDCRAAKSRPRAVEIWVKMSVKLEKQITVGLAFHKWTVIDGKDYCPKCAGEVGE